MANVLVTSAIVAKEALAVLENMLSFSKMVNRDFEDEFTSNMSRGYAPGQTINIKRPPRYTYRAGRVAVPQSTTETTIPLTLSQGGVDLNFTSLERTLSLTKLNDKVMAAMAPICNEIDRQGLELARFSTFNAIGTPGVLPTTQALALAAFTGVNQRLDEMAAPRDRRRGFVMNPALNASMIQGLAGLFNSTDKLSEQYGSGMVVDSLGLMVGMDQNVAVHTNGTQPAGPTASAVNGAGQSGSVIAVNGAAITGTITRGSRISWGGVNAVNPQSRASTGTAAQFVVTADVAAGATSIPISPPMVPSGAFQNVTGSPANNATLAVFGAASAAYNTSVAFHKDAFTLAMVPMWSPPNNRGVISVSQQTYKGFTVKVTEGYDIINDNTIMRIDALFGWAATYSELAVLSVT